jgi:hypothetical protein
VITAYLGCNELNLPVCPRAGCAEVAGSLYRQISLILNQQLMETCVFGAAVIGVRVLINRSGRIWACLRREREENRR